MEWSIKIYSIVMCKTTTWQSVLLFIYVSFCSNYISYISCMNERHKNVKFLLLWIILDVNFYVKEPWCQVLHYQRRKFCKPTLFKDLILLLSISTILYFPLLFARIFSWCFHLIVSLLTDHKYTKQLVQNLVNLTYGIYDIRLFRIPLRFRLTGVY